LQNREKNMSQKLKVLSHLRSHNKGITSWEAIVNYRITRLADRIKNLKDDGHSIETIMEDKNGKRFARYYLVSEAKL
jgi:hypothetical protein